jgi:nucleoside-diphosphate-sugar epimerase
MNERHAVILGATSQIAPYLVTTLANHGWSGILVSRGDPDFTVPGFSVVRADVTAVERIAALNHAVVISLLPLWICAHVLARCDQPRQVIAFSSTSVVTKRTSTDSDERQLAARLQAAEDDLKRHCAQTKIPWTLLRPTMIYGAQRDQNVTAMARFIRRFGFFPIAAPGRGLRQPVHVEDLAAAAFNAIDNPAAANRLFSLPGGETLSYRAMVERVFDAAGKKPRVLTLPTWSLRVALPAARPFLPARYGSALFERMNEDLAFDIQPAQQALQFQPRHFQP